jgi:hypothetical protein
MRSSTEQKENQMEKDNKDYDTNELPGEAEESEGRAGRKRECRRERQLGELD